ncbi:MAG: N-acetylglucosamine malate deacetylase 1 [Abditibacteriota bacterium]|nr:N-acetylglucosamine malate deacetylase 1 [Abditibacteriota bacterium]
MSENLRIIVFGAHPDDCDITCGGTAALWAERGYEVCFVSVTNGDAGHHIEAGAALARRRHAEAQAAAQVLGVEYVVLDHHDGELLPTLENRREIIRLIREHRPHLVLGPRPNDYHPDHRYTAVLVQDAAYMVTVPNVAAFADHLSYNPTVMYLRDHFQKPYPFIADAVVDIESSLDKKLAAMACHVSQFFEWLPYNGGYLLEVPEEEDARRDWFFARTKERFARETLGWRQRLLETYGPERGAAIRFCEAFEVCEYGSPLNDNMKAKLFSL